MMDQLDQARGNVAERLKAQPTPGVGARGFTIVEVLVVVAVIAVLIGILLPALSAARERAIMIQCAARQQQVGTAIHNYANHNKNSIPYGPEGLPASFTNLYPRKGIVTNLISLQNAQPVGLGLLLKVYLADTPEALFCPGSDQPVDVAGELAKVGVSQAQGSYFYRHGSGSSLAADTDTTHTKLDRLGKNRNGKKIRALAMDTQMLVHPSYAPFGIVTRTHHRFQEVNVLFDDGHVEASSNAGNRYTVEITSNPYAGLDQILLALEKADELVE